MLSRVKVLTAALAVATGLLLAAQWEGRDDRRAVPVRGPARAGLSVSEDRPQLAGVQAGTRPRDGSTLPDSSRISLWPDTKEALEDFLPESRVPPSREGIVFLQGVVTDPRGRPLADVEVSIDKVFVDFGTPLGGDDSSPDANSFNGESRTTTSSSTGSFLFEDRPTRLGGRLSVGGDRLQFGPRHKEVDTETDWQVLTLPDPRPGDSTWRVTVTDQDGSQVLAEEARLYREPGRRSDPGARKVHGALIRSSLGLVEVDRLPPGEWTLVLRARNSLSAHVATSLTETGVAIADEVSVHVYAGASTEVTGPSVDADGTPWVNSATGLDEWLPENLLRMGEVDLNRHFAQTLRLGHGDVRTAELEIEIEATGHASANDVLFLESLGGRDFAWKSSIDALTRARWKVGARELLRLDLARLPHEDGATLSLLPHLADGMLDVVIQDDTAVHGVTLRVVR